MCRRSVVVPLLDVDPSRGTEPGTDVSFHSFVIRLIEDPQSPVAETTPAQLQQCTACPHLVPAQLLVEGDDDGGWVEGSLTHVLLRLC